MKPINEGLSPDTSDGFSIEKLSRYWWLIRRRLWLVIILAIIGGYYKYGEIRKVQELYSSQATIILDGAATDRAVALLGVPGARYGYQNELYILRSDQLAKKVAQSLLERFDKTAQQDTLFVLRSGRSGIASVDNIARRVKSSVRFYSKEENESIIEILTTARDPDEAAIIANTYAYTYQIHNKENSIKQVIDAKRFLQIQIENTTDSLRMIEQSIIQFLSEHGFSYLDQNTDALMAQLSSLYEKLDDARLEYVTNIQEVQAIDSTLSESRARETESVLETPDLFISYYEEKIKELKLKRDEDLSRIRLSSNVDSSVIKVTDQQIEFYEEKLKFYLNKKLDNNILLSNVDGSIAKYWVALNARKIDLLNRNQVLPKRISELEDKINKYSTELETVPFLELEYEKLSRRKQRYEQALTSFYNRLIETELAEASEGGYVDILDNAIPRPYPINKQTTTGIFQGVFFGIGFAVLLIIGLDRIDTRIKTNEDIEGEGINLVAGIPSMNEIISKEFNAKNFIEFGGTNLSTKLLSVLKPLSGISELYRRLRSNFLFSLPDLKNKSIVVTSANPQEGKSVTASNLAIVLAQSGKSVLLVDADLRRPNLDVLFGVRNSPGLSDLIINELDTHEVIYPTVADNLNIIPAGNPVPNPAEIIGSASFKRVHGQLTSEFDYVIYDSPPVNSVVDAVSIAEQADLVLVIVKAGKTKRKELKNALGILHYVEQKVMGVLLNNINSKNFITDYNYYSNYNYYGNRTLKDEEFV